MDLVDLPEKTNLLSTRWVYKIKSNNDNIPIRYKSRLVVQGFKQQLGVDYIETFSTTCRLETYRILLILAIANN